MAINPMEYGSKDVVLDVVRTERAKFYDVIDNPDNWNVDTRCEGWEVRDMVGHMIDVTEGYLDRWDAAHKGEERDVHGLLAMASMLNDGALAHRSLSPDEAIARLKSASEKMMEIFDGLSEEDWGGFNVTHAFMGAATHLLLPCLSCYGLWGPHLGYALGTWRQRRQNRCPNSWCFSALHVHFADV